MSEILLKQYLKLVKKFLDGTADAGEVETLERYYMLFAGEPEVIASLSEAEQDELEERLQQRIGLRIKQLERRQLPLYRRFSRYAAAAVLLLCMGTGAYLLTRHKNETANVAYNRQHDIQPGGNKAVLTLSSGKKISLTDASNGKIAQEAKTTINKTKDGEVVYQANAASSPLERTGGEAYNTITIPRKGTYHMALSDGTLVWLNAESSLRYPVAFTGAERKVELSGEAYFEVAHNTKQPFKVVTANETVQDIGTHFDINAYHDEPVIKTTLLEGAVKVWVNNTAEHAERLKPGQQAILQGNRFSITEADADQSIAWKNNIFQFESAGIPEILRQASRWYDVAITYEGTLPDKKFGGTISRNVPASRFLDILKYSGVKFRIEGKKIIVTP